MVSVWWPARAGVFAGVEPGNLIFYAAVLCASPPDSIWKKEKCRTYGHAPGGGPAGRTCLATTGWNRCPLQRALLVITQSANSYTNIQKLKDMPVAVQASRASCQACVCVQLASWAKFRTVPA